MSDTPFKTPLPFQTPKSHKQYYTPSKPFSERSDSDESISSDAGSELSTSSDGLSIVAMYDDLMRQLEGRANTKLMYSKLVYLIEQSKLIWVQWKITLAECQRLQNLVDARTQEFSEINRNLMVARKLIDEERKKTKQVMQERDDLELQIAKVHMVLFKDNRTKLADETKEQLAFLNRGRPSWGDTNKSLSAIPEGNSTGSILTDFSYSRSEDDLDSSRCFEPGKDWKKHRASAGGIPEPSLKKRRSSTHKVIEIAPSDTIKATTTLTVTKQGPITATSIIESVPVPPKTSYLEPSNNAASDVPPANLIFDSWARVSAINQRTRPELKHAQKHHCFQQKTVVMPDNCVACEKRIRFGRAALKCKECRSLCHVECRDKLPLPCIPLAVTPGQKNFQGVLGDYTPAMPPMVPAIIVHCLNEIEQKGMQELGIYRIPGSERDVKLLKEKFLKGKGSPNLRDVDVHVICGCVKDFLRNLADSLVTYALRAEFVKAVEASDARDVEPALCQAISELPRPNRDTLAFMILHLQRVANSPECKMSVENISKVFGPTIVGYSSENPNPNNLVLETGQQVMVMERLLRIPSDYWLLLITVNPTSTYGKLQQTPSTDSLLRPSNRTIFTPRGNQTIKRKQRFFGTPPGYKD